MGYFRRAPVLLLAIISIIKGKETRCERCDGFPFPILAPYSSFLSLPSPLELPVQTTSFSHIFHPFRGNVRVCDAKGLEVSLLRGRRNGGIKGNHVEKEGVREGWKVEM